MLFLSNRSKKKVYRPINSYGIKNEKQEKKHGKQKRNWNFFFICIIIYFFAAFFSSSDCTTLSPRHTNKTVNLAKKPFILIYSTHTSSHMDMNGNANHNGIAWSDKFKYTQFYCVFFWSLIFAFGVIYTICGHQSISRFRFKANTMNTTANLICQKLNANRL